MKLRIKYQKLKKEPLVGIKEYQCLSIPRKNYQNLKRGKNHQKKLKRNYQKCGKESQNQKNIK
jgi:hypothetical protein